MIPENLSKTPNASLPDHQVRSRRSGSELVPLLLFLAGPSLSAQAQPRPDELVDVLNKILGRHAGARASHTMGFLPEDRRRGRFAHRSLCSLARRARQSPRGSPGDRHADKRRVLQDIRSQQFTIRPPPTEDPIPAVGNPAYRISLARRLQ